MANKLLNFRCPDELLAAIDEVGKARYPADNDNGYDRSKTLLDLLQVGILALTDGTVDVPVSKTSKTDSKTLESTEVEAIVESRLTTAMGVLQAQLQAQLEAFEQRLGKAEAR